MNDSPTLKNVLAGCLRQDRNCQRELYRQFYGYAMSICLRYAKHREEAAEILNDAFFKVFSRLGTFRPEANFKPWLRQIVVNTAIDHFRKNRPHFSKIDWDELSENELSEEMPLPVLSPDEDVLPALLELSPGHRMVFNLYVMEEYSHTEIAEVMGIEASTSRSSLARAVKKLAAFYAHKLKNSTVLR